MCFKGGSEKKGMEGGEEREEGVCHGIGTHAVRRLPYLFSKDFHRKRLRAILREWREGRGDGGCVLGVDKGWVMASQGVDRGWSPVCRVEGEGKFGKG